MFSFPTKFYDVIFDRTVVHQWSITESSYHIFPNSRQENLSWTPKNKISAKKKYFTINFIHLIHKACQILFSFTYQCHFLHFNAIVLLSLQLSPPLHWHSTSSSSDVSSIKLDIQHFLKPFTFNLVRCLLCRYIPHILHYTFIFLGL
jgi:hypothetical protein